MRRLLFGVYLIALVLSARLPARAERLPLKAYTVADGLPNNVINKIVRDSRGFLWFCTAEGLSRFDGYSFTNYGVEQGLPHTMVNDFLETRNGELWIATNGGLTLFNPRGEPIDHVVFANEKRQRPAMFSVVVPEEEDRAARAANVLLEDHSGTIWCGTMKHLYRLDRSGNNFKLVLVDLGVREMFILDLLEDRGGSVWIGSFLGLYCYRQDGRIDHFTKRDGLPDESIHDLLEDHQGRLWAATRSGGFFRFGGSPGAFVSEVHNKQNGFPTDWVFQLFETSDQMIWLATNAGVIRFSPAAEKNQDRFHPYTQRNGLTFREITALNEDMSGNLWLGTNVSGAMKLERHGFLTWDEQDGIVTGNSIFGDNAGEICVRAFVHTESSVSANAQQQLGVYDDKGFHWFMPDALANTGWIFEQVTLQARNGEWWIGTGSGLFRFAATDNFLQLKSKRPLNIYTTDDGLATMQVLRLFEDSSGDIWISTVGAPNGLARWRHETAKLENFANALNLPNLNTDAAFAFREDASRNVWIGFSNGVARFRDGNFSFFTAKDGLPPGGFQSVYLDHASRLWIGSLRSGLVRVNNPADERPTFATYTTTHGLSSNATGVIIEDLAGLIYVGTGRGLDQIDPDSGHIKHFTIFDGLATGGISSAFRDRTGALWFGTQKGLSRFMPERNQASNAPPIVVNGLRVMGQKQAVSQLGEKEISLSDLPAGQNQIQIDFVGLSFAVGDVLRYQYRLENSTDWTTPSEQRTVNFASLSPGRYRFLVRAVNSDGLVSEQPAVVAFRILPPIWQRWWVVLLAAIVIMLTVYSLYRYRLARLLELERVRTRIASDLHDDIGSNLSLVAGLSEVLRKQARHVDDQMAERLSVIANASRQSVEAMGDIVWAVNPKRDNIVDLSNRMRRFANDTLTAQNIEFQLDAPRIDRNARVNADVRREVFLIFKESINNIARHSRCKRADAQLRIDRGVLILVVKDDGCGFQASNGDAGQGLESMKRRANRLGGDFKINTGDREGTVLELRIPLKS